MSRHEAAGGLVAGMPVPTPLAGGTVKWFSAWWSHPW